MKLEEIEKFIQSEKDNYEVEPYEEQKPLDLDKTYAICEKLIAIAKVTLESLSAKSLSDAQSKNTKIRYAFEELEKI